MRAVLKKMLSEWRVLWRLARAERKVEKQALQLKSVMRQAFTVLTLHAGRLEPHRHCEAWRNTTSMPVTTIVGQRSPTQFSVVARYQCSSVVRTNPHILRQRSVCALCGKDKLLQSTGGKADLSMFLSCGHCAHDTCATESVSNPKMKCRYCAQSVINVASTESAVLGGASRVCCLDRIILIQFENVMIRLEWKGVTEMSGDHMVVVTDVAQGVVKSGQYLITGAFTSGGKVVGSDDSPWKASPVGTSVSDRDFGTRRIMYRVRLWAAMHARKQEMRAWIMFRVCVMSAMIRLDRVLRALTGHSKPFVKSLSAVIVPMLDWWADIATMSGDSNTALHNFTKAVFNKKTPSDPPALLQTVSRQLQKLKKRTKLQVYDHIKQWLHCATQLYTTGRKAREKTFQSILRGVVCRTKCSDYHFNYMWEYETGEDQSHEGLAVLMQQSMKSLLLRTTFQLSGDNVWFIHSRAVGFARFREELVPLQDIVNVGSQTEYEWLRSQALHMGMPADFRSLNVNDEWLAEFKKYLGAVVIALQ